MEGRQINQRSQGSQAQEQEEVQLQQVAAEVDQDLVAGVDDILDEIDGLLEENAEDFVKGFVQKGGQ